MPLSPLARRLTLGGAMAAAGLMLLFARPDAALAHHIETDEEYSCAGWTVRAEYIGGDGDRMIVVDVTINGEHIDETFVFDDENLGHQDYWLLYKRSGTGSLRTSGTITMYERARRGGYTIEVDDDGTDIDLVCTTPTATRTATATPRPTDTPVPTATSTATPEDTPETEGSVTPLPTDTPEATATPEITTNSTITPLPTSTPQTPDASSTPSRGNPRTATSTAVVATPTFTDEVRGGTPPARPPSEPSAPESPSGGGEGDTPETGTSFPDAGDGGMNGVSFAVAMLGFALVIVGVATVVGGRGLRSRK